MKRFTLPLMIALLFAFAGITKAQLVIDFETGDFSQYAFDNTVTPSYPWTIVTVMSSTGNYCMRSGNAGVHNSTSTIEASIGMTSEGYVTFDAECKGEGYTSDECTFSIDGVVQLSAGEYVTGWHTYGFMLTAGDHVLSWSYDKDSSVHPDGDYFQVDNITFGLGYPCVVPETLEVNPWLSEVEVNWDGAAESYTLRYAKEGTSNWTVIDDIHDNHYTITDVANGHYVLEVWANCAPDAKVTETFSVYLTSSNSEWYAYCTYDDASLLVDKFINFNMQDPLVVNQASDEFNNISSVAFIEGYAWFLKYDGTNYWYDLCKAPIDNVNKTFGEVEIVKPNFTENWTNAFTYNPVDHKVYFIENNTLKSFDPQNPGPVTSYGITSNYVDDMVITNNGTAYAIFGPILYQLDLANAEMTELFDLGTTFSTLSYDNRTGELFGWSSNFYYYIDIDDESIYYQGFIGEYDFKYSIQYAFTIYGYTDVEETVTESLNVYPNPVNDKLYIDNIDGELVSIFDNTGRMVKQERYQGSIDVSRLASGIYAIKAGESVVKFVKE